MQPLNFAPTLHVLLYEDATSHIGKGQVREGSFAGERYFRPTCTCMTILLHERATSRHNQTRRSDESTCKENKQGLPQRITRSVVQVHF